MGVQALRGVAACMVVVHHATALWWIDFGSKDRPLVWENGASGVDIFFVISGFVMAVSSLERDGLTASKFMWRRLIRIVPMYWLITSLALLKLVLVRLRPTLGSSVVHLQTPLLYIAASYFFIPFRNSSGGTQPIVPAGWTLSFEMFFYALFACALALKTNVVRFLTLVILTLSVIGLLHYGGNWPVMTVLTGPMLLEFLAGVLLGQAVRQGFRLGPVTSLTLGALGLGALIFLQVADFPGARPLEWGIPALLVVQAAVMLEGKLAVMLPRWALRLGDASYSLYLVHGLVLVAVARVIIKAEIRSPNELAMAIACVFAAAMVSLVLYRFIEKPMNEALGRRRITRSPSVLNADRPA